MLVKLLKDTEVNGRKYLAGETREFDEATATALLKSGDVALPDAVVSHKPPTEPVKKSKKK